MVQFSKEFRDRIKKLRQKRLEEIKKMPFGRQRRAREQLELEIARLELNEERKLEEEERIRGRARFKARGGVRGEIVKAVGAPQAKKAVTGAVRRGFKGFKERGGVVGVGVRAAQRAREQQRKRIREQEPGLRRDGGPMKPFITIGEPRELGMARSKKRKPPRFI